MGSTVTNTNSDLNCIQVGLYRIELSDVTVVETIPSHISFKLFPELYRSQTYQDVNQRTKSE